MQNLFSVQKLLTVETVTKVPHIVQLQFIWWYNSVWSFTKIRGKTMRCYEGQQEYCSSCLPRNCKYSQTKFVRLEQPDLLVLQNVDQTTQDPWRPTWSGRLGMEVRVHVGNCAPRHILKWIQWRTGSPWSSSLMAAEIQSCLCILRIRRAAEWRTDCSDRRASAQARLKTLLQ